MMLQLTCYIVAVKQNDICLCYNTNDKNILVVPHIYMNTSNCTNFTIRIMKLTCYYFNGHFWFTWFADNISETFGYCWSGTFAGQMPVQTPNQSSEVIVVINCKSPFAVTEHRFSKVVHVSLHIVGKLSSM